MRTYNAHARTAIIIVTQKVFRPWRLLEFERRRFSRSYTYNGPGVYTLNRRCVDCTKLSLSSAICPYLVVEFVPVLLFFFCITIFRLDLTSGQILGYVIFFPSVSRHYQPGPMILSGHMYLDILGFVFWL